MSIIKRILMIDDDEDHLRLCKWILQRKGYEVKSLSQLSEVMEVVNQFNPDLVFMDHYMSGDTGIDITKRIKSTPTTRHIPVIYFSSCDDLVQRATEAGADAYLEKPFHFDTFFEITKKFS